MLRRPSFQKGRNGICWSIGPTTWKVMQKSVWNDIVSWRTRRTQQLYKVSTPCIDDHHFKEEEMKSVGDLSKVCSQIVQKWLIFGKNWTTWYSMVSKQTCTSSHQMDRSVWQTPGSIDFLYTLHDVITDNIAMWVIRHNNAGWCCILPKTNQYRETCCARNPKENRPTPRRRNTSTPHDNWPVMGSQGYVSLVSIWNWNESWFHEEWMDRNLQGERTKFVNELLEEDGEIYHLAENNYSFWRVTGLLFWN